MRDGSTTAGELVARVQVAIRAHPHVRRVALVGSRANGSASPLSDWDFTVEVDDFSAVTADLPTLVAPLEPLARQWDRLNPDWCYMLMLPGPTKVDLIVLGPPHEDEPPWTVSGATLAGIDDHFWDWILWLASKREKGQGPLVRRELGKMSRHLLRPMGVVEAPGSIEAAIDRYTAARDRLEGELGVRVSRRVEAEVRPAVLGDTAPPSARPRARRRG